MLVSNNDYWEQTTNSKEIYQKGRNSYKSDRYDNQSAISSVASSNVTGETLQTNTSIFPGTASYVSSVYAKSDFGNAIPNAQEKQSNLLEKMERMNLLAKYNGVNVYDQALIIKEHGEDYVTVKNKFVQLKPKLKLPIPAGKFARWFQVVDPNATIQDDIKMARGVLRKDRFQNPNQLDNYLGVKAIEKTMSRHKEGDKKQNTDKEQQYRVKRVRNKLKHWNAMYKQLHDAIASVDHSNYTMREKVQHVDQICSIYVGRAERAIDCFYAEAAAHFMLDMVVSLQKKVADARAINQSYQSVLLEDTSKRVPAS